jgi:hypothetical protein
MVRPRPLYLAARRVAGRESGERPSALSLFWPKWVPEQTYSEDGNAGTGDSGDKHVDRSSQYNNDHSCGFQKF